MKRFISLSSAFALLALASGLRVSGQEAPTLVDSNLMVRTVAEGLDTPTAMAFIGEDDILVLEKGTGLVRRITDGAIQPNPVLDLAVNSASERGLLIRVPGDDEASWKVVEAAQEVPRDVRAHSSADNGAGGRGSDGKIFHTALERGNRTTHAVNAIKAR